MDDEETGQSQQPPQLVPESQTVSSSDAGFGRAFNELRETVKEEIATLKVDAKDQKNYMLLGFFILVFMLAALVLQAIYDKELAYTTLSDKVESLQQQVDMLSHIKK